MKLRILLALLPMCLLALFGYTRLRVPNPCKRAHARHWHFSFKG